MATDHQNPFASPMSDDAAAVSEMTAAGAPARRLTRLVASIVDSIIMSVAALPLMYFLELGWFDPVLFDPELAAEVSPWNGYSNPQQAVKTLMSVVVSLAVFLLLNGYFLHLDGQTLGKKLFGIKIVRKDGSRASLSRLFGVRLVPMWVAAQVPFLGQLVAGLIDPLLIFRKSRYCLHDDIADTAVVLAVPYEEMK